MRVEIDKKGVMYIIPENETEVFTLNSWIKESAESVHIDTVAHFLPSGQKMNYWRFDKLIVSTSWPRTLGDR